VQICGKCEAENPDGAVFCNACGERMVVSYSEDSFGDSSVVEQRPYYEAQFFGETSSFTRDGFMLRVVPVVLFVTAFGLLLLIGGASGALLPAATYWGLYTLICVGIGVIINLLLVMHYEKTGRPVNFGGGDVPRLPSASQTMEIEDDTRERDTPSPGPDMGPSRNDRRLLRR